MGTGVGEMFLMAIASTVASQAMQPNFHALKPVKPLDPLPVTEMPDPLAQNDAQKKKMLEQMTRSGRASTILTDGGSDKLGG